MPPGRSQHVEERGMGEISRYDRSGRDVRDVGSKYPADLSAQGLIATDRRVAPARPRAQLRPGTQTPAARNSHRELLNASASRRQMATDPTSHLRSSTSVYTSNPHSLRGTRCRGSIDGTCAGSLVPSAVGLENLVVRVGWTGEVERATAWLGH